MSTRTELPPSRLRPADLARVATAGLRTRRLRATLSALGIALGIGALVAVLGLSASSQAGLLARIDRLGTNLLTVQNGSTMAGALAIGGTAGLLPALRAARLPPTEALRAL